MEQQEIRTTPVWDLYQKGRDFLNLKNAYEETDRHYRFYSGDQWHGAKLGDVEPVQENIIKPIIKYKRAVIHSNLYAINFSSMNFENRELSAMSDRYCGMLNRYATRVWEQNKVDSKCREITRDAAINDEGIFYIDFDKDKKMPLNEVIKKVDIYYGDETNPDIQSQPYIIIRKRMPLSMARDYAESHGISTDKLSYIIADTDTFDESGDDAKQEVDNQTTLVFKLYKDKDTVKFSSASRYVEIENDVDLEISLYPVAHFCWESKEGSARGEGECRHLIPNQIEINKTLMRRLLTAKKQAFPRQIVDISKVTNPDALNTVGGIIKVNDQTVDDVKKVVGTMQPAQMSPDVKVIHDELIQNTRDLAGAGDAATGTAQLNSQTSGRAILAQQSAAQAPISEMRENFKTFIEDVASIWLEYLIAHSKGGVMLEEEMPDQSIQVVRVPQSILKDLQATVKIDITPKSPFDKFAQEQMLETMLTSGLFSAQRLGEVKAWATALDDDTTAPKQKILDIIKNMEQDQLRIAQINAEVQATKQRAQQFFNSDVNAQAQQLLGAEQIVAAQQMAQQQ